MTLAALAIIYLLAGVVIAAFAKTVVGHGRLLEEIASMPRRTRPWQAAYTPWVVLGWPVFAAMVILPDWPLMSPFRDDHPT